MDLPAPIISEETKKMAEAQRAKYVDKEGADIVDILYAKDKANKQKFEDLKQKLLEEKQKKESEEYTYKPQTLDYESANKEIIPDRKLHLYNSVSKGSLAAKHNKTSEEIEFEKNSAECTYKPQVNHKKSHVDALAAPTEIKGLDKFLQQ